MSSRQFGIIIAHKAASTLRTQIMRSKMPLNATEKSEVVYTNNCANCEKNFIGETGNRLTTRRTVSNLDKYGGSWSSCWLQKRAKSKVAGLFIEACICEKMKWMDSLICTRTIKCYEENSKERNLTKNAQKTNQLFAVPFQSRSNERETCQSRANANFRDPLKRAHWAGGNTNQGDASLQQTPTHDLLVRWLSSAGKTWAWRIERSTNSKNRWQ